MLTDVFHSISRPFAGLFEKTGTDMEPDPPELRGEEGEAGERDKEHLLRLFVGWVPKLFTESDLLPLFQQYGEVRDIIILKDKLSGQPRGCAFVSYGSRGEAEAAIAALDKGVHLPGALCPLEVRYARSHQYVQAGAGPQDNRQLFFARVPLVTSEEQIKQLFSQFGEVEEINLFRERRSHLSKGCGFVTMARRDQAVAAMAALDEKQLLEGSVTPLAVKWADPELQIKKRRAVEDSNAENRMLFFAKVLRSASEDEVRALFAAYGRVVEVNLFRAFQGAPTTKGCGLVTMGSNDEAAAAIDALDARHVWEGMEAPMVVKWMDAALQKRRREEHLAAMRQGLVPSMSMSPDMWLSSRGAAASTGSGGGAGTRVGSGAAGGLSRSKLLDAAAASKAAAIMPGPPPTAGGGTGSDSPAAAVGGGGAPAGAGAGAGAAAAGGVSSGGGEVPPVGCSADAYKLFVGNIPKAFTEEELRPVFESVGPVVELVVVRDKFSHESKGSAFVWYTCKADADQAVLQFNLCRVLQDPTGEQDRPLVVRRANMRKPAAPMMLPHHAMPGGGSLQGAGGGGLAAGGAGTLGGLMDLSGGLAGVGLPAAEVPLHLQPLVSMQVHKQQQQQQYQAAVGVYGAALGPQYPALPEASSASSLVLHPFSPAATHHQQQHQQQQGMALRLPAATQQQQQQQQQQYVIAGQLVAPQPGGPLLSLSLQVTSGQMAGLSGQLFSIGAMAGCDISSVPAAGGTFFINLGGPAAAVEAARGLVAGLLGQMSTACESGGAWRSLH